MGLLSSIVGFLLVFMFIGAFLGRGVGLMMANEDFLKSIAIYDWVQWESGRQGLSEEEFLSAEQRQ